MSQWRDETTDVEKIGLEQHGNLLVILTLDKQTLLVVVVGFFVVVFCYCFVVVLRVSMNKSRTLRKVAYLVDI